MGNQARKGGSPRQASGAGTEALRKPERGGLNPATGRRVHVKEIALFPQVQPRCTVCRFCILSLPESLTLGGNRREGSSILSGKVLPAPRWAEGESDIFLGLSPGSRRGHLAGLLLGTRAEKKETFRPGLDPLPRARVPALGHLLPARESEHPGRRCPQGTPGTLRATWSWLCGDLVPNPRGPGARGGRGGAEASSTGRARGRPGIAEPPRGRDWELSPGAEGERRTRLGPACARRELLPPSRPPRARPVPAQGAGASQLTPPAAPAAPPSAGSRFRLGLCSQPRRLVPPPPQPCPLPAGGQGKGWGGSAEGGSGSWADAGRGRRSWCLSFLRFPAPEAVVGFLPGCWGRGGSGGAAGEDFGHWAFLALPEPLPDHPSAPPQPRPVGKGVTLLSSSPSHSSWRPHPVGKIVHSAFLPPTWRTLRASEKGSPVPRPAPATSFGSQRGPPRG